MATGIEKRGAHKKGACNAFTHSNVNKQHGTVVLRRKSSFGDLAVTAVLVSNLYVSQLSSLQVVAHVLTAMVAYMANIIRSTASIDDTDVAAEYYPGIELDTSVVLHAALWVTSPGPAQQNLALQPIA